MDGAGWLKGLAWDVNKGGREIGFGGIKGMAATNEPEHNETYYILNTSRDIL